MRNFFLAARRSLSFPAVLCLLFAALALTGCGHGGRDQARESIKRSGHSFTADEFIKAAAKGDQGLTSAFLQAGMDRNAVDSRGYTALMAAAETGQTALVKSLLDENAKPDLQNKSGATALLLAAAQNRPDTVRALIEGNADTRLKDRENWTPLSKAVVSGHTPVVDVLLKTSADQLKRDGQLDRVLATASMMGKTDFMGALLDRGANVNAAIENGRTALMYAAVEGNKDAVTFLLDHGANPRLVNKQGANASVLALENGQAELSKYIDSRAGGGSSTLAASRTAPAPSPQTGADTQASPAPSPLSSAPPDKADAASVAMERAWLKQNGIEPSTLLNKDLGLDDDHDGFTNDEELAGGTNPGDPLSHPPFYTKLRMKRVDGESFPVLFDGIEGKKIRVTVHAKSGDGSGSEDGRQFSLNGGDRVADLPYTVSRVRRRAISEKDTGRPEDVSELTLSHVQTGRKVVLVRGMTTNSPDAAAVVTFGDKGEEMSLRQGQTFTLPQDPATRYEVVDIRPRQVILRIINSGQTITVPMSDDKGGQTVANPSGGQ